MLDKYGKRYHITIKMKSVDVQPGTFIEYGVGCNDKDQIFKIGDYVRISKYKKNLQKATLQIRLWEFL